MTAKHTIDVAVAVVIDDAEQVLISFRHPELHQGNLWEFPGGKCEPGESVETALHRELLEELNVQVRASFPLKTIRFEYPDKSVRLHVRRVTEFTGDVQGMEGQAFQWRPLADLKAEDFPAANAPIIKLLQLPSVVAITPELTTLPSLNTTIKHLLASGCRLIQLRQPQLSVPDYAEWFAQANKLCQRQGATLIFNGDLDSFRDSEGVAYHANTHRLMSFTSRPVALDTLFSCSCHSMAELQHAVAIEADFASLSPVAVTAKYPASAALGWAQFREWNQAVSLPLYALGGLNLTDLPQAKLAGAHGICGISMFGASADMS